MIEKYRVLYRGDETRQRFYAKGIRDDYHDTFRVKRFFARLSAPKSPYEKGASGDSAKGWPTKGAETKGGPRKSESSGQSCFELLIIPDVSALAGIFMAQPGHMDAYPYICVPPYITGGQIKR